MTHLDLDLARVLPCQVCRKPTRTMTVPVAGSGYDLVYADRTTCADCRKARVVAAADGVRHKVTAGRRVILTR